jgi:hypothetical protein
MANANPNKTRYRWRCSCHRKGTPMSTEGKALQGAGQHRSKAQAGDPEGHAIEIEVIAPLVSSKAT